MTFSAGFGRWLLERGCRPADIHTVRDPDITPVHGSVAPPEDVIRNFTLSDLMDEGNAKQIWGYAPLTDPTATEAVPAWRFYQQQLLNQHATSPEAIEEFVMRTAYKGTTTLPNNKR